MTSSTTTVAYWRKRVEAWEAVTEQTPVTQHEAKAAREIVRILEEKGGVWTPQGWKPAL